MSELSDKQLQDQVESLTRGCVGLFTKDELAQRLRQAAAAGRPMRIKFGMDPTAPDIHLGHTVQLKQLRKFQDLGHKAVVIIGDYTARIGDPSGVNKTRPILTPEQIRQNADTYVRQAGAVLDTSPEKLEIRSNSEWLAALSFADVLRLARQMTVARMMERDTFELRFKAGVPIGVHEFLYPLIQGYDSICVEADVEIGGTDQTFNNLVGRQLQENADQPPQIVMIFPILVGLDGVEKMSKSKGNYIGVTDPPNEMFGKVMSIPDTLMDNYFSLLTEVPREKIDELVDSQRTHPRQAKAELARTIVATYHDAAAATAASEEFDRVFSQHDKPTDMPTISTPSPVNIVQLVHSAGFAPSTSQARRLVAQGAVSIDGEKITDANTEVSLKTGAVLKVGKRRFGQIEVE